MKKARRSLNAEIPEPENRISSLNSMWSEFETLFPTEQDCWKELYRNVLRDAALKCRYCGAEGLETNYTERVSSCKTCKRHVWITAGTFFDHIRIAKAWLGAIWLMERGVVLSSSRFQKLAGIAQSSALNIIQKIRMVIENNMNDKFTLLPSRHFETAICKRSRETPAKTHPRDEEKLFQESSDSEPIKNSSNSVKQNFNQKKANSPSKKNRSAIQIVELSKRHQQVFALITEKPISFDSISQQTGLSAGEISAALTILELNELISCLPGNHYSQPQLKISETSPFGNRDHPQTIENPKLILRAFFTFVREHFHGISRKYLQFYVAAFWCHNDRNRWKSNELLSACIRSPRITDSQLLDYVTQPLVKIVS